MAPDLSQRATILVSFAVGWVANELTDILDKFVKDAYDIFIAYIRGFFKGKKWNFRVFYLLFNILFYIFLYV